MMRFSLHFRFPGKSIRMAAISPILNALAL
jgi:hypothetical protein